MSSPLLSFKAFSLCPIIERRGKSGIESIEVHRNKFYVGTTDGCVLLYHLAAGSVQTYTAEPIAKKHLGLGKKRVERLCCLHRVKKLLVLCNGNLILLSMSSLALEAQENSLPKGVTAIGIDEDYSSKRNRVAVAKRKQLQIFEFGEEFPMFDREVAIADAPVQVALCGPVTCVASPNEYYLLDMEEGIITELFGHNIISTGDGHQREGIICKLVGRELLLPVSTADTLTLGMFVLPSGETTRAPLNWPWRPRSIAFHYPYILAVGANSLCVHSILDQQLKQTLQFKGGHVFADRACGLNNGPLLVASATHVYVVEPERPEMQARQLFCRGMVLEGIELARSLLSYNPNGRRCKSIASASVPDASGSSKEEGYSKTRESSPAFLFQRLRQEAGFIHLSRGELSEASALFLETRVDAREVILLFPAYKAAVLPSFIPSSPPLHNISDIRSLTAVVDMATIRTFLIDYLDQVRSRLIKLKSSILLSSDSTTTSSSSFDDTAMVSVDLVLVRLYAETHSSNLPALLLQSGNLPIDDTVSILTERRCFNSMALFYEKHGRIHDALEIWRKLGDVELMDESFESPMAMALCLSRISDVTMEPIFIQYASWIMLRDPEIGMRMFTEGGEAPLLTIDKALAFLSKFTPISTIIYLEHIVLKRGVAIELLHTRLALLLVDYTLEMRQKHGNDANVSMNTRARLYHVLSSDNAIYRTHVLLARISDTDLHRETALLYGREGDHERAIGLLVHRLKDFSAAEEYCVTYAHGRSLAERNNVFLTLLKVYLDSGGASSGGHIEQAVELLNSHVADFEALEVLAILPSGWSIGLIERFLTAAMRQTMHSQRQTRVIRNLHRVEHANSWKEHSTICQNLTVIDNNSVCDVCERPFPDDAAFVRFPNSVIAHLHCVKGERHICPITGVDFRLCPEL